MIYNLNNSDTKKNIVFFDEIFQPHKWYNKVNQCYVKILEHCNYNIISKCMMKLSKPLYLYTTTEIYDLMNTLILEKKSEDIYIFNPKNFSILLLVYYYLEEQNKHLMFEYIDNLNYIVIWQEILMDDFFIIGYEKAFLNKDFIYAFFKNAGINLISNSISFKTLKDNNINNCIYHTIIGYSPINNIIPLQTVYPQTIDILIYGTLHDAYKHRNNMINDIKKYNSNNLNIKVISDNYDLDSYLNKTKIVIHIPSYDNLQHMPWAKITTLQSKKIFFIIEDNQELYDKNLNDFIISFKSNDINDLYSKINYYINNEEKRNEIIEKNYDFIVNNYNMDTTINNYVNIVSQRASILHRINNKKMRRYIFFNENYGKKWSSHVFYYNMMKNISDILKNENIIVINMDIQTFQNYNPTPDDIFVIDPLFIYMYKAYLHRLINHKYIVIIGENLDVKHNTFTGWDKVATQLNFNPDNIMHKLIKNAYIVTYQNDKIKRLIISIKKNSDNVYFFPIDGYNENIEQIKHTNCEKDIDVLFYGGLTYSRRVKVINDIFSSSINSNKIIMCNNIFNINDLLNRSKIVLHVNCVDDCYHVPYAKIIKPLLNNNILLVENTPELEKSEIKNYIHTFNITNNNSEPEFITKIKFLLENYESEQEKLLNKNPQQFIIDKLNFKKNVLCLLSI